MTVGTIVQLDPQLLRMAPNVRKNTKLSKEFLASIKEFGVETPIVVVEREDGYDVVDGQRRTLAALDVGLESVDCYVTEPKTDVQRIESQIVVNEQREGLDRSELVGAVQELALFDVKVPAIAKKLGLDKGLVEDAVKVGGSSVALALYEKDGNLEKAALLAEFEGDPAQEKLLELANGDTPWQMTQRARELLEQRERDAVKALINAFEGVTLVKEPDYYSIDPLPVSALFLDAELTNELDDQDEASLAEIAGDGLVAWPDWVTEGGKRKIGIRYGVRGWQDLGLHTHEYRLRQASGSKELTPEEVEQQSQERRAARLNTKSWVAVSGARITWLQELVQRKVMPKGWEPLAAARMLANAGSYSTTQMKTIRTILQISEDARDYSLRNGIVKALEATPTRAPQIMLAIELGCVEGGMEFDKKGWLSAKDYLKRLEGWGYQLSEFEKLVVSGKTVKAVAK